MWNWSWHHQLILIWLIGISRLRGLFRVMASQIASRTEYLIPTGNMLMLLRRSINWQISNLVGRCIRFIVNWICWICFRANFLSHSVYKRDWQTWKAAGKHITATGGIKTVTGVASCRLQTSIGLCLFPHMLLHIHDHVIWQLIIIMNNFSIS